MLSVKKLPIERESPIFSNASLIPVLYALEMQFQVLATQKLEPACTVHGHTGTGPGEREFSKPTVFRTSAIHPETHILFSSVAQSCPTLCDPMNRSMPGLPVHQMHITRKKKMG